MIDPSTSVFINFLIGIALGIFICWRITRDEYDSAVVYFFGVPTILCISMIPSLYVIPAFSERKCIEDKIISVGGCSRDGTCGVMTSKGHIVESLRPVVGQVINVKCWKQWVKR